MNAGDIGNTKNFMLEDNYKNHRIFESLKSLSKFYDNLSYSTMSFLTHGVENIFNIDANIYSSMQGTVESIHDILGKGRINDAYALLRKYYDSVMINIYQTLVLESFHFNTSSINEKINNWVHAKERLPEYRVISQYIRNSDNLKELNKILIENDNYKQIRERCNDHTHYNYFHFTVLNDNEVYIKNRSYYLHQFNDDIENLFIMHIIYVFYLKGQYMMGSDYIDSLELGIVPEENSQYFVAAFIQDILNSLVKKKRPDLYNFLKEKSFMFIE